MRLVKTAKASPYAKFYSLSTVHTHQNKSTLKETTVQMK